MDGAGPRPTASCPTADRAEAGAGRNGWPTGPTGTAPADPAPGAPAAARRTRHRSGNRGAAGVGGPGRAGQSTVFSHTDTCFSLSSPNGVRCQSSQRCTSRMPAIRAIRSSSAGQTYRNGTDRRLPLPSATRT
ncbi:hypothetical protein SAMN05421803_116122 [Nocardiopsis flavescens]|uniref:Uncharacterized protein n=1 Tax=Nocardiopsis flavescens TaxID=758803 RepID=A0A1M6R2K0_9ACTN|nr:hypothetical protein SAMN05421803_116122 [Nocardiopsis flavescens]